MFSGQNSLILDIIGLYFEITILLENPIWAGLTWSMMLLPGFGCGLYEILRKPLAGVEVENPPNLLYDSGTVNPDSNKKHGLSQLSFGLEVLPAMVICIPDNIILKIIVIPFYLVLMAVWFPFLPFIQ